MMPLSAELPGMALGSTASEQTRSHVDQSEFSARMAEVTRAKDQGQKSAQLDEEQMQALRESAQKLISNLFLEPIFKQIRNGPFKNEMFSGGMGGDLFGSQLDQVLSDRMAKASNWPMVDQLVEQFTANRNPQPHPDNNAKVDLHG